ncbi:cupin domain-containing protein [Micromonospora sp. SL1-18]|uniref:cupin domain-containing protein n=1 Tax=Micromonospora sp. SL1-18 TaxID=3399128 RepID=UPI003A4E56E0
MNAPHSPAEHSTTPHLVDLNDVPWPELQPDPRAVVGDPQTRTITLVDSGNHEAGLWECTPGEFASDHRGYIEFIHVIDGDADLVGDDGSVVTLAPGTIVTIPDGWSGRWRVRRTVVKSFAIIRDGS